MTFIPVVSKRRVHSALIAISLSALIVQGCGPNRNKHRATPGVAPAGQQQQPEKQGETSTVTDPNAPVTPLPEPHGSVDFHQIHGESGINPLPAKPNTKNGATSENQPYCKDAHSKNSPQIEGLRCPMCFGGAYAQKQPKQAKLDILFVADSSPSLETERTAIAAGIQKYIGALPENTDYRIAVIAAHSDVSYDPAVKRSTGLAGKLLTTANEKAVLKKEDFRTWSALTQALTRKLKTIKADGATDGGEAGLFSLDKAISEPLLSENRRLGFFRSDAALAVVFISDENDLCSYGVNYPEGVTPKPNVNMYLKTGLTVEEKANQIYCRDESGQPTITSHSVLVKLRELKKAMPAVEPSDETNMNIISEVDGAAPKALPLIVSGILYTTEATVPTKPAPDEKYPEYFGENEVGYGYLDIIHESDAVDGDLAVDISKGNFADGLRRLGEAAARKMAVKSTFQLTEGTQIDPNTLCVLVDGKEATYVNEFSDLDSGMSYVFQESLREVQVRGLTRTNAKGKASTVEVSYCESPSVLSLAPEVFVPGRMPTLGEHYRSLPVPKGCNTLKSRIQNGEFDY